MSRCSVAPSTTRCANSRNHKLGGQSGHGRCRRSATTAAWHNDYDHRGRNPFDRLRAGSDRNVAGGLVGARQPSSHRTLRPPSGPKRYDRSGQNGYEGHAAVKPTGSFPRHLGRRLRPQRGNPATKPDASPAHPRKTLRRQFSENYDANKIGNSSAQSWRETCRRCVERARGTLPRWPDSESFFYVTIRANRSKHASRSGVLQILLKFGGKEKHPVGFRVFCSG